MVSFAWRFISSFPIWMPLISFSCVVVLLESPVQRWETRPKQTSWPWPPLLSVPHLPFLFRLPFPLFPAPHQSAVRVGVSGEENVCVGRLFFLFSCSVESDSLWPRGLQHAKLPCPSLKFLSQSLLTFLSAELVMPSNHLILCYPLLLLPSVFPSIKVFSSELAFHIRCHNVV